MNSHHIVNIGSRRELFVDHLLVEELRDVRFHQHEPRLENVALKHNADWESTGTGYITILRDGDQILDYYRGAGTYCVAESADGIHFTRPDLGLHEWRGSRKNNIILTGTPVDDPEVDVTRSFAPFLNTRPGAPEEQRFLALGLGKVEHNPYSGWNSALFAYASADGLRWTKLQEKPVIMDGAFDSQNVAFWSEAEGCYVACYRTFTGLEGVGDGPLGPTTARRDGWLRRIKRATSEDFIHWAPGRLMDYRTAGEPAPLEEFYINQTRPYFRAPHIYIALPARFMEGRRALSDAAAKATGAPESQWPGCSDACFMTARPGNTWYDRTFLEALVKPRIGDKHWTARCNYPVDGIIQTGETEMSIYIDEFYAQKENQLRRYSLRLDGFSSIRAPLPGGELLTKTLTFSGNELELNYATSAAGSLRVEIRDDTNTPIPGFTLDDAVDIFGNRIAGRARWTHGANVSALAGRPVRLRLVMHDADLFALRFVKQ